jgi:hypothetical protein
MQYVWRELRRRIKSYNNPDLALVLFFDCAWHYARYPYAVKTEKECAAGAEPLWIAAGMCHSAKEYATNPELASALKIVSKHFIGIARRYSNSLTIVKQHGGDDVARGYVMWLGFLTRGLFESPLDGTVAITASVALGRKITRQQVRNWTKPTPVKVTPKL